MTALSSFVERFHLWIDKRKCTVDTVYLRSAISSEEEAFEFVKSCSATTGTDWVIHHGRPHSPKYVFVKTWVCHRSWNRKTEFTSPDDKCNAKIQVLLKKINSSANKIDAFLSHNPPLCCVIRLTGKHSHTLINDDNFQMVGLTTELKEKFYEYFQIGLSATEARTQHEIVIHSLLNENKILKHSSNLTSRQAQRLYNHWENVKDTIGFSKENADSTLKFTFEELLKAIPKMLPQSSKESTLEPNSQFFSDNNNFQPPLTFVCAESTETSPSADGHLLYKLKYGAQQTFVSCVPVPPISLVRIQPLQNSWEEKLLEQSNIEDVSIKLEPIDYDDPTYSSPENAHGTPMVPITPKSQTASSLNLCFDNDISDVKNCIFPLVFTSTDLPSSSSNYKRDAPLLYSLKCGPHGLYATSLSTPNILAVQIPSSSQTTLTIKNANSNTEVTLDSHVQVEHIKTEVEDIVIPLNPQIVSSAEIMPIILDVSSCKKRKKRKTSSKTYLSKCCISSQTPPPKYKVVSTAKPSEPEADEDYHFLMSLLPHLKQMPQDQKKQVKKKIQEFVITSRIRTTKVQFQNLRSNIYRDCGVLPSIQGWKF